MKGQRFEHSDSEVQPKWDEGIPRCQEDCPLHDGKRCELLGYQAPQVCEPMVRVMGTEPEDNAPCRACGSLSFLILGRRVRRALLDVAQERKHQDSKWGVRSHNGAVWMAILGEEVGEANRAVLRDVFDKDGTADIRAELIQVAAVAVAIIEQIDTERLKSLSLNYMRTKQ